MARNYEVNNVSIESILSWIKLGEIAIPEMQRPFVWEGTKVRNLIDSLYKGYPVGYIVSWKNPDVKLKDGTTSAGKKIIIDGQQRVTALMASVVGVEVIDKNYKKKRIKISFNPIEEKFEVFNPAISKNAEWIDDISILFKADFNGWSFVPEYCSKNNIEPNSEAMNKIGSAINNLIQIKSNTLGVIDLNSELTIETVTEIFIRINSEGVILSQADFAMSKISSNEILNGINMRKTVDYFCHLAQNPDDYRNIRDNDNEFSASERFSKMKWIVGENNDIYKPSYSDLLRVAFTSKFYRGKMEDLVSLLSGRDFETREYKMDIVEYSFKKLDEGIMNFINETNFKRYLMIIKSTGIIDKSLVRSQHVLNFGYILYLVLKDLKIESFKIEKIVRKWIILSILTGRYSNSPESAFDYDIKKFRDAENIERFVQEVESGDLSDAFWDITLVNKLETSVTSSPYFNLYLISQVKSNCKGFLSESITIQSLIEHRGDIHHVFPKKYLQNNGLNNRNEYNQIANYVYMQSEINIKIKDKSPNVYFKELIEQCTNNKSFYGGLNNIKDLYINLNENCIPKEIFEYDINDYSKFLEDRRKLMSQAIKKYYFSL